MSKSIYKSTSGTSSVFEEEATTADQTSSRPNGNKKSKSKQASRGSSIEDEILKGLSSGLEAFDRPMSSQGMDEGFGDFGHSRSLSHNPLKNVLTNLSENLEKVRSLPKLESLEKVRSLQKLRSLSPMRKVRNAVIMEEDSEMLSLSGIEHPRSDPHPSGQQERSPFVRHKKCAPTRSSSITECEEGQMSVNKILSSILPPISHPTSLSSSRFPYKSRDLSSRGQSQSSIGLEPLDLVSSGCTIRFSRRDVNLEDTMKLMKVETRTVNAETMKFALYKPHAKLSVPQLEGLTEYHKEVYIKKMKASSSRSSLNEESELLSPVRISSYTKGNQNIGSEGLTLSKTRSLQAPPSRAANHRLHRFESLVDSDRSQNATSQGQRLPFIEHNLDPKDPLIKPYKIRSHQRSEGFLVHSESQKEEMPAETNAEKRSASLKKIKLLLNVKPKQNQGSIELDNSPIKYVQSAKVQVFKENFDQTTPNKESNRNKAISRSSVAKIVSMTNLKDNINSVYNRMTRAHQKIPSKNDIFSFAPRFFDGLSLV